MYRDVAPFPWLSYITLLLLELLALASKIHFVVGSIHSNVTAFGMSNVPDDKSTSPGFTLMTVPAIAASYAARTLLGATSTTQAPNEESREVPTAQKQSLAEIEPDPEVVNPPPQLLQLPEDVSR